MLIRSVGDQNPPALYTRDAFYRILEPSIETIVPRDLRAKWEAYALDYAP